MCVFLPHCVTLGGQSVGLWENCLFLCNVEEIKSEVTSHVKTIILSGQEKGKIFVFSTIISHCQH